MAAQGQASVQDILKLADYKKQYREATTDEARKAASLSADTLRSNMGWGQGTAADVGGFRGNYTEQQLRDLAVSMDDGMPAINNRVSANSPTRIKGSTLASDYGITQDRSVLENLYTGVVDTAFKQRMSDQRDVERTFLRGLGTTQDTVIDAQRKLNAAAISSGMSNALSMNNALSAVLGLSQEGAAGSLEQANARAGLYDQYAADTAEARLAALVESNAQGGNLMKAAMDALGYDTSRYVGELSANSQDYASALAYLGQLATNESNLEATRLSGESNVAAALAGRGAGGGTTQSNDMAALYQNWDLFPDSLKDSLTTLFQQGGDPGTALALIQTWYGENPGHELPDDVWGYITGRGLETQEDMDLYNDIMMNRGDTGTWVQRYSSELGKKIWYNTATKKWSENKPN